MHPLQSPMPPEYTKPLCVMGHLPGINSAALHSSLFCSTPSGSCKLVISPDNLPATSLTPSCVSWLKYLLWSIYFIKNVPAKIILRYLI